MKQAGTVAIPRHQKEKAEPIAPPSRQKEIRFLVSGGSVHPGDEFSFDGSYPGSTFRLSISRTTIAG